MVGVVFGMTSNLQSSEKGSEDVDLKSLLSCSLRLFHTISEMSKQLLTVFLCYCWE